MAERIRIWVHPSLKNELNTLRQELIVEIKKKYGLKELTIDDTFTSQVLSSKMNGNSFLSFKINKTGLTKGVLKFVGHK